MAINMHVGQSFQRPEKQLNQDYLVPKMLDEKNNLFQLSI